MSTRADIKIGKYFTFCLHFPLPISIPPLHTRLDTGVKAIVHIGMEESGSAGSGAYSTTSRYSVGLSRAAVSCPWTETRTFCHRPAEIAIRAFTGRVERRYISSKRAAKTALCDPRVRRSGCRREIVNFKEISDVPRLGSHHPDIPRDLASYIATSMTVVGYQRTVTIITMR